MCCGQFCTVENFTAGGFSSVKVFPIPGSGSDLVKRSVSRVAKKFFFFFTEMIFRFVILRSLFHVVRCIDYCRRYFLSLLILALGAQQRYY